MQGPMLDRRAVLGASLAGLAVAARLASPAEAQSVLDSMRGSIDAAHEGLRPGAAADQSAKLTKALGKAASSGQALFLPPGRYEVAEIDLPAQARLVGVPGQSQLVFRGGAFLLKARHGAVLRMQGVTIDGGGLPLGEARGLLECDGVDELVVEDCAFLGSAAAGASLRDCAGRVDRSRFAGARTVGLSLSQSRGVAASENTVADCGDTGILVIRDADGADDTILRGNRVSGIRADSGGTGQYGNGINLAKANGVVVADNRVDNCAFSAIRCFSSDDIQMTGNVATRSGETALYVEFAFEGAVVANNLIDTAVGGISFANFMTYGGRLSVCSGNIVRNITGGPDYADGNAQPGQGISAEADAAITGNVIENAQFGLLLGFGPYLRDISATGNVVRGGKVGIAVTVVEGAGPALIANNLISGATEAAIRGMRWHDVASGDLAKGGAEAFPHLTIEGNRVS